MSSTLQPTHIKGHLDCYMRTGNLHSQTDVDAVLKLSGRQSMSDARLRGLQLERMQTGQARWRLRYTMPGERQRQCLTLGDANVLTLAQARGLATQALQQIALGNDPQKEKAAARAVPRFDEFIREQYMPHVETYKASPQTDWSLLKNHLLPRFAKRYMDEITRQDIVKMLHDRQAEGAAPGSVNRLLIMMRYIFNLAIRWEVPGIKTNPCRGIEQLKVNNKFERYLSPEEGERLYQAVCASDNPMLRFIVPMLLLTGARRSEVLNARWQDFDVDRRTWRIPKTKSGFVRHVPLSDGALNVLQIVPRLPECEYVFANPQTGKPYHSVYTAWHTARKAAGLSDVRMHDLRHTHASYLVNAGRTLYEVQKILGHTQVKTTQRYAHLSHDTLVDAANAASRAAGPILAGATTPAPRLPRYLPYLHKRRIEQARSA